MVRRRTKDGRISSACSLFWPTWVLAGAMAWTCLGLGHDAQALPKEVDWTRGSGGIGVRQGGESRPAARRGLPHVTETPDGFEIRTGDGRLLRFPTGREGVDRFFTLWWNLHNPQNGYFSRHDVPFHSVEEFIVEAPDYGHLTTSETFSFWLWLEAAYARYTGDFSLLEYAMETIETYAIPDHQPSVASYQPSSPALFAPEEESPSRYPVPFDPGARSGQDPIAEELRQSYGTTMYGMHWLVDTTNWYGFGRRDNPTYINTFQRGVQESVWEAIPHPSIENFRYGSPEGGYLNLYIKDPGGYKRQWRYTNAPDADARVVQAMFDASQAAKQHGRSDEIAPLRAKAAKMGDFLRYSFFDKYFKRIGCESPYCPQGTGMDSAHYLLSWYYAWGGSSLEEQGSWSWRIGCSHAHFGYQNPMTAYVLSKLPEFAPKSPSSAAMWGQSLSRQIEMYQWLQSREGAIAGGATSSYLGQYAPYPRELPTFYNMVYESNPVYKDPGSNTWFGWQAWSMQRMAQYYRETGDTRVAQLLDRWVAWVVREVKLTANGGYAIPATLEWTGAPEPWTGDPNVINERLGVRVTEWTTDVGITAALAKTILQYAEAVSIHRQESRNPEIALSKELLQRLWSIGRDDKGLSVPEVRADYVRLDDPVFVPQGYQGVTPDGVRIDQSLTFAGLRPRYSEDPDYQMVRATLAKGEKPVLRYHRFWAEVEAALAYAEADPGPLMLDRVERAVSN